MIRSFIAIDLPAEVADLLTGVQADLPFGRPAAAGTLHVTLAFLGDQPANLLEDVHLGLDAIRSPAFRLAIGGLGSFGGRQPRVLFAAIRPEPALSDLRARIRSAVRGAGLELKHERFTPHVTLARFGDGLGGPQAAELEAFVARHADLASAPFPVTRFAFYRSTLTRSGAVHDEMASYALAPEERG